jgi:hypothetical protein
VQPERLGKLKKFVHLIGYRTRDLPACSIVLAVYKHKDKIVQHILNYLMYIYHVCLITYHVNNVQQ